MKIYTPLYFRPEELLPPEVFTELGARGLLLFPPDLLRVADRLREVVGRLQCNTWYWHRGVQTHYYRGFRPYDCKVGAKTSMHKMGLALDFMPLDTPVEDCRKIIQEQHQQDFAPVRRMEMNVNWLHLDMMPTGDQRLVLFNG